jgi:hypothetical protein
MSGEAGNVVMRARIIIELEPTASELLVNELEGIGGFVMNRDITGLTERVRDAALIYIQHYVLRLMTGRTGTIFIELKD